MNTDKKDRIRYACEQLNANPNFTLSMTEIMPLVMEVDALFGKRDDAEAEKSAIVERLRAQADAIEKAEQKVAETKEAVATAFDAYFTAQGTLKDAQGVGVGVTEAETAVQVAQAAYELSGAEHDSAEKEYDNLLKAASGVLVVAEVKGETLPEVPETIEPELTSDMNTTETITAGSVEDL